MILQSTLRLINSSIQRNSRTIQKWRTLSSTSYQFNKTKDDEIVAENWKLRCDLATAYRGFEKFNMHEGVCNHLTVKAPSLCQKDPILLIIPYGIYWREVTPECLVGIDIDTAKLVEGKDLPDLTAHSIHRGIYRHRPDVNCVMHTHAVYSAVLSVLEDPTIKQVHQNSTRFYDNVAYDTGYEGIPADGRNTEADRIGKVVADKEVLVMGNHGLATLGPSVAEAFDLHYYFERAAEVQVKAYQTGKPLRLLDDAVAKHTYQDILADRHLFSKAFFYGLQASLKREDPTFIK